MTFIQKNKKDINEKTFWKKEVIKEKIDYAIKIINDEDKDKRLLKQLCPLCFYSEDSIGGASFTTKNCVFCNEPQLYGSTNTQEMCEQCSKNKNCCKTCGCDINLRTHHEK